MPTTKKVSKEYILEQHPDYHNVKMQLVLKRQRLQFIRQAVLNDGSLYIDSLLGQLEQQFIREKISELEAEIVRLQEWAQNLYENQGE